MCVHRCNALSQLLLHVSSLLTITPSLPSGYRYGKSLIPITADDEEAMKLNQEKQLCVLGFTKASAVRHQCIIGSSVQVIVGSPDDEVSSATK